MKSHKPENEELANTLSGRISQLREKCNMTVLDLARACRFSVKRIESIESGSEVWLSVTDRAIIARALRVTPSQIKEVEVCPSQLNLSRPSNEPYYDSEALAKQVLDGQNDLECPKCGQILISSIEQALDFEGHKVRFARAYCPKCPFALH